MQKTERWREVLALSGQFFNDVKIVAISRYKHAP